MSCAKFVVRSIIRPASSFHSLRSLLSLEPLGSNLNLKNTHRTSSHFRVRCHIIDMSSCARPTINELPLAFAWGVWSCSPVRRFWDSVVPSELEDEVADRSPSEQSSLTCTVLQGEQDGDVPGNADDHVREIAGDLSHMIVRVAGYVAVLLALQYCAGQRALLGW